MEEDVNVYQRKSSSHHWWFWHCTTSLGKVETHFTSIKSPLGHWRLNGTGLSLMKLSKWRKTFRYKHIPKSYTVQFLLWSGILNLTKQPTPKYSKQSLFCASVVLHFKIKSPISKAWLASSRFCHGTKNGSGDNTLSLGSTWVSQEQSEHWTDWGSWYFWGVQRRSFWSCQRSVKGQ